MARPRYQTIRDARSLLDLRELRAAPENFRDDWIKEPKATTPLRAELNKDSDYDFLNNLYTASSEWLEDNGINGSISNPLVAEALASPTFAVRYAKNDHVSIRHAIANARNDEYSLPFELLTWIDASIRTRHVPTNRNKAVPAAVIEIKISHELLDLENDEDLITLLKYYFEWCADYPEPHSASRNNRFEIVILGSPLELGSHGTPDNWRNEFTNLAMAFGSNIQFAHGPNFKGTLGKQVQHIFRLEPYSGNIPVTARGHEIPSTKIDARITSFDDILHTIALEIIELTDSPVSEDQYVKRDLLPGERVYHRKIGSSRHYDSFDAGSHKPCNHKKDFIRFNGPKSLKGFAARYSNFESSWMYHCPKYPNCGMYAVYCPEIKH